MFRLEVIDYIDQTGRSLVARVPEFGTAAIQSGAQLIVQQNQEAVFFRDGRAMDSFGPGRHTLTTANIPILGRVLTIPWEKSPFQACVYFVGKHRYIDQGWGTRSPITMKDPDFGIVRLRGFGKYSYRVVDATLLINELVGTQGKVTTEEVGNYLRDVVVSGLSDLFATANVGLLQMAAKFDELSAAARVKIGGQFKKFGLELTDFVINNVSPPEEVQKAIDARSSMTVVGDMRSYTLYQAANGLSGAGGGVAAGAAQLGMGAGIGMMLPGMMQQAQQPNASAPVDAFAPKQAPPTGSVANAVGLDFSQLASPVDAVSRLQTVVRQLADSAQWNIEASEGQWTLTVPVGTLRKQRVHLDFSSQDDAGHAVMNIWSSCGSFSPGQAITLLRFNAQLIHGAFAIQVTEGNDLLVLRANLLVDTADALELTRTITSIAWQADRMEEQLYGVDNG
ncbi:SPFH domain-containing protein [Aureliella helgolandensis]|uniref:SPFH domain / Band 7 family protein n=1 Tax=Aureliella helgolandensis TaxID=2527968 RepID=A0A518GC49_9BACT|nr:SPFH domain-containing protein [Aureliella helgolandensis]QDV26182.1 SPFH domain / Band 7 family protein [Aureliella helgolandensis]